MFKKNKSRSKKQKRDYSNKVFMLGILILFLCSYYVSLPKMKNNSEVLFEEKEIISDTLINEELQVVEISADSLMNFVQGIISNRDYNNALFNIGVVTESASQLVFYAKNNDEYTFDNYFFNGNSVRFLGTEDKKPLLHMPLKPLTDGRYGFECYINDGYVKLPVEILASIAFLSTKPKPE